MATPISFSPVLTWVDATDPNNIPADVRIITASDLLRYENFGKDASARINSIESTVEGHTSSISNTSTTVQEHENAINALENWQTGASTDIANLKKQRALSTKTANYTTTAADSVIIGNSASAFTITLLSAATATAGKVFTVKNKGAGVVTVASASGTIDGATTKTLAQWASADFVSDGTNWFII